MLMFDGYRCPQLNNNACPSIADTKKLKASNGQTARKIHVETSRITPHTDGRRQFEYSKESLRQQLTQMAPHL